MNLKDKDCPELKELRYFVFDGAYQEIDNWFKKHQISKKPALERDLTLRLLNETYFFAFHCVSNNREVIQDERNKRELAILRNLKCENQIKLFSVAAIDEVNSKHFEVIKMTTKNKEILQNSSNVCSVFTKLFHYEQFDELDKIETLLKRPILDQISYGVSFHYQDKYSHGTSYLKIDEPIFSPKYDIVFNYTDSKKDYLKDKGIALPTVEDVSKMQRKILMAINESSISWRLEDIERITQTMKNYKIQKNYLDLNDNLGNNNKNNKKLKI